MAPKPKLFNVQSGLFLYKQPEQSSKNQHCLLEPMRRLSIVATYCLGSCGCCSSRRDVYCRLCCRGGDWCSCLYAGDSLPSCAPDDGWNLVHHCGADSCRCCFSGMMGAGRGCYGAAWSRFGQIFHLPAASVDERGCCSTAGPAACGAATSYSPGDEGKENRIGPVLAFVCKNCRAYRSVPLQVIRRRVGPLNEGWRSVGRRSELDRFSARVTSKIHLVNTYKNW